MRSPLVVVLAAVTLCSCADYSCCDDPFWGEPWGEWCIQMTDAYCNVECT
jgi:hypothetical protein